MNIVPVCAALPWASVDSFIAGWFRARLTPDRTVALEVLTTPGSAVFVCSAVIILALFLSYQRHWHRLARLILTVPGGALLGETIKLIVQRPRPFISGPFGVWGGYSFPSGHTIAATLLFAFVVGLCLRWEVRRRWRVLVACSAAVVVMGVALSRIALGAHYLTDVLSAMTIGMTWVGLSWYAIHLLRRLYRAEQAAGTTVAQNRVWPVNRELRD